MQRNFRPGREHEPVLRGALERADGTAHTEEVAADAQRHRAFVVAAALLVMGFSWVDFSYATRLSIAVSSAVITLVAALGSYLDARHATGGMAGAQQAKQRGAPGRNAPRVASRDTTSECR